MVFRSGARIAGYRHVGGTTSKKPMLRGIRGPTTIRRPIGVITTQMSPAVKRKTKASAVKGVGSLGLAKKFLSRPSQRTIAKNLKELRSIIDSNKDPILCRIAYEMETAVRWATENTVGWPSLRQQAIEATDMLRKELLQQDSRPLHDT